MATLKEYPLKKPAEMMAKFGTFHIMGLTISPKTKKITIIFDCSANFRGESLNQHLLQGADLTNNLIGVLCTFRQELVAFMRDIEAKVNAEQSDFLRFFWWEGGNLESSPIEYRMTVNLFGVGSSLGCCNFGLKHNSR